MAIIINFLNGGKLVARGERLGFINSTLSLLRLPFWVKSKFTDTRYLVNPATWTHIQPMTDDEFTAQMAMAKAQADDEARGAKKDQRQKPRLIVPGRP